MRNLFLIGVLLISFQAIGQKDSTTIKNDSILLRQVVLQPKGIIPFQVRIPLTKIDSLKASNLLHKKTTEIDHWTEVNKIGLDLHEVAFVNWNSGGSNSISALLGVAIKRNYDQANLHWKNELLLQYGLNKQKDLDFRKTDDKIEVNSTFGYQTDSLSNWFYSAKLNFDTQFSKGYKYPNTEESISGFMAPAYLFLGVGSEYNSKTEELVFYVSPLTMKTTFVLDDRLANAGAFGVEPAILNDAGEIIQEGENIRSQVGILLTNEYNTQVFENITLNNKLSLYTDYLNKFGNIDVNWELNFTFKVNKYVVAKLGSHLKYDDDIKLKEENDAGELISKGPSVQWKQQLGIGVIVNL